MTKDNEGKWNENDLKIESKEKCSVSRRMGVIKNQSIKKLKVELD